MELDYNGSPILTFILGNSREIREMGMELWRINTIFMEEVGRKENIVNKIMR